MVLFQAARPPPVAPMERNHIEPFGSYAAPGASVSGAGGENMASGCWLLPSPNVKYSNMATTIHLNFIPRNLPEDVQLTAH